MSQIDVRSAQQAGNSSFKEPHYTAAQQQQIEEKEKESNQKLKGIAKFAGGVALAPMTFGTSLLMSKSGINDFKNAHHDAQEAEKKEKPEHDQHTEAKQRKEPENMNSGNSPEPLKEESPQEFFKGNSRQEGQPVQALPYLNLSKDPQDLTSVQNAPHLNLEGSALLDKPDYKKRDFLIGYQAGHDQNEQQADAQMENGMNDQQKQAYQQGKAYAKNPEMIDDQTKQQIQQMPDDQREAVLKGMAVGSGLKDAENQKQKGTYKQLGDNFVDDQMTRMDSARQQEHGVGLTKTGYTPGASKDGGVNVNVNGHNVHLQPGTSMTVGKDGNVSFESQKLDGSSIQASQHPGDPEINQQGFDSTYQSHRNPAFKGFVMDKGGIVQGGNLQDHPYAMGLSAGQYQNTFNKTPDQMMKFNTATAVRDAYADKGQAYSQTTGKIAGDQQNFLSDQIGKEKQAGKSLNVDKNQEMQL